MSSQASDDEYCTDSYSVETEQPHVCNQSTVKTVLKFRCGRLPSLGDPAFNLARSGADKVRIDYGWLSSDQAPLLTNTCALRTSDLHEPW